MKKILFAIFIFFAFTECSSSQFLKGYRFQGGVTLFWQYSTNYGSAFSYDEQSGAFGIDIGILGEFALYKKLSGIGGLHLSDKGISTSDPALTIPGTSGYNYKTISNRFRYLTLQLSIKYNFKKPDYGFYTLCGLRTDLMLQNYYTGGYADHLSYPNGGLEAGLSFGFGYDFPGGLLMELQYNPNIAKIYRMTDNGYNWNIKVYRTSFILYIGYMISTGKDS